MTLSELKEFEIPFGKSPDVTGKRYGDIEVVCRVAIDNSKQIMFGCLCHNCGVYFIINKRRLDYGIMTICDDCCEKQNDLSGQQIGELTINYRLEKNGRVYYNCSCSCGNNFDAREDRLKNGTLTKCPTHYYKDILGNTFNELTVVECLGSQNGHIAWRCSCSCGKSDNVIVTTDQLNSGHIKSCGHLGGGIIDMTGRQYGELTVLEQTNERDANGGVIWKCLCSCGNICKRSRTVLENGDSISCGHVKSIGEANIMQLLNSYGIPFDTQHTFDDCRFPDTNKLALFDFYIYYDKPFIVEFDGWGIHDGYTGNGWNTRERYEKTVNHDNFKNEYCFSHNIPIKRIPYYLRDTVTLEDIMGDEFLLNPEQWWEDDLLDEELSFTPLEDL